MFVLALKGRESEGLYAADSEDGDRVLYLFKEEDDAQRFVGLMEADNFPKLVVIEVDEESTITVCEANKYNYVIIEPDDLIIPPNDSISKN